MRYHLNTATLTLYMEVPPHLFPATIINAYHLQNDAIRPEDPGGFINYDVFAEDSQYNKFKNISALTELGFFNPFGVGTTNFLFQHIQNQQFPGLNGNNKVLRLDTTWTLDQPEKMASLRLGDSITRPAEWSNSVHFAGIQYSTNFATQPGFVTFPTPAFHGEAIVPTTVNILINNALVSSTEINSGPFSITNVPVITGAGEAQVVTHNILGQQTLVILPYYTSQGLLKPGLDDFSYEVGMIRNDYGINNFDYSRVLGVGTYRHGFTSYFTGGWHAELLRDQQTAGISNDYLINRYGIFSIAMAGSHNSLGMGGLLAIGFQRQAPFYNYGINASFMSHDYIELGILPGQLTPKLLIQSFAGITSSHLGSFSIGYTLQKNRETIPTVPFTLLTSRELTSSLLTINYNRNLFKKLYFSVSGIIDTQYSKNDEVLASLIWSFDNDVTINANNNYQYPEQNNQTVEINKNLPFGNGYGYRLLASNANNNSLEADFSYQNNDGTYTSKFARIYNDNNYELEAQGALIEFGGKTSLSRATLQSFALVKVPNIANIAVYNRNQIVGYTDKNGDLFIPYLLPYQVNDIRINPKDLPLNIEIDQDHKEVTPYYRSGVLVKFKVKRIRSALFTLLQAKNRPVPSGLSILIEHKESDAFVGDRGQVYLNNLPDQKIIHGTVQWDNQLCHFEITLPKTEKSIFNLKNIFCKPVSRNF